MKVLSVGQQTKIQKAIVKPLNESCNIVNGFNFVYEDVIVNGKRTGKKRILVERTFEDIGMLNILSNFEVDNTRRSIRAIKKEDGKIISNRKYITGDCKEADAAFIKGLYIVDFSGIIDLTTKDVMAERIRSLVFIGIKRENGKFRLAKDIKDADLVMMPYAVSPSLIKHSRIYYAVVDKDGDLLKQAQARFNEIDVITGHSVGYKWAELLLKDNVSIDDISKIADRIGICTTTPMMKVGHINNVFFMDAELDYGSDYEENNDISAEIGTNFADGAVRYNGDTLYHLFKALFPRLKPWMMFGLSLQGRCDTLLMKAHGRFFRARMIARYCKIMMAQNLNKCHLVYNGKMISGKALKRLPETKLNAMLSNVDLVGTKDEFKAVNMAKIKNGCNLYIVAMSNVTSGKLSNQAVAKVAKDYAEEIQHFCKMAAVRAFYNREAKYSLRFDSKSSTLKLAGQAYENKLAANPDVAEHDRHVGESLIKADDSFARSMTASANIPVNAMYLRLTPDDSIILTGGTSILNSTWVDYIEPGADEGYGTHMLEVYCPAFEEKHLVRTYDNRLSDSLRTCVGIKYPSQAPDEYAVFKCVSLEELKGRIAALDVDDELKQDLIEFYETCPNNCIMVPADNTWKNQCAGSDFDGDDLAIYFEEVEYDDNDELVHYGLFEELNEETGEVNCHVPGFTSLAVRKYAVKNNNIGQAAIITYK